MIILDTHIWVWWVDGDARLTKTQLETITTHEDDVIGICTISVWEVAKLFQLGKIEFLCSLQQWFDEALNYPGVRLVELTPDIAIESTQLPGVFHRDPADQIIVATARVNNSLLVTSDGKILQYPHVKTIS